MQLSPESRRSGGLKSHDFRAISLTHDFNGLECPKDMTESHPQNRRFGFAPSTSDLFVIVKQIGDAGGQLRPLVKPWADTSTSAGRLMIAVLGV
jgi:hypothetical protein